MILVKFNSKRVLVGIYILFSLSVSSCIYSVKLNSLGEIRFGNKGDELRYTLPSGKVFLPDVFPDDFVMDVNGSIYICEKYSNRILKYSPTMELLNVIELNQTYFKYPERTQLAPVLCLQDFQADLPVEQLSESIPQ